MDAATEKVLAREVEQAARATARRWPSVPAEDIAQEAWALALTAAAKYRPEQGSLGAYIGRTLRTALRNHCYRHRLPVHYPKNKEYKFAHGAAWSSPDCSKVMLRRRDSRTPELAILEGEHAEDLRRVVMELTAECPQARPVLLGSRKLTEQARRTGVPLHTLRRAVNEARDALRRYLET